MKLVREYMEKSFLTKHFFTRDVFNAQMTPANTFPSTDPLHAVLVFARRLKAKASTLPMELAPAEGPAYKLKIIITLVSKVVGALEAFVATNGATYGILRRILGNWSWLAPPSAPSHCVRWSPPSLDGVASGWISRLMKSSAVVFDRSGRVQSYISGDGYDINSMHLYVGKSHAYDLMVVNGCQYLQEDHTFTTRSGVSGP